MPDKEVMLKAEQIERILQESWCIDPPTRQEPDRPIDCPSAISSQDDCYICRKRAILKLFEAKEKEWREEEAFWLEEWANNHAWYALWDIREYIKKLRKIGEGK